MLYCQAPGQVNVQVKLRSADKRDIKEALSYYKIPGLTYLLGESEVREVMEVTDRATLLANIFLLAFLHLWPLERTGSDM